MAALPPSNCTASPLSFLCGAMRLVKRGNISIHRTATLSPPSLLLSTTLEDCKTQLGELLIEGWHFVCNTTKQK